MIKNLVLKGGGVLGQAYTGALLELDKRGIMVNLERVAGTSAGSIVAVLVAMKYTTREIFDISAQTNFKSFEDGRLLDKINVAKHYGINPGDEFLKWITEKITRKGLPAGATFKDFKDAGFLDLHVFATDLNTCSLKAFSVEETPDVCVAEAIRASMSIPLFFEAYKFRNNNPDSHIYVDGGVVFNYPLACFDNGYENKETLGLFVGELDGQEPDNKLDFYHFIQYTKALIGAVLAAQNINIKHDLEDMSRTIVISSCGVSPTNFSLTFSDKMRLFEAGRTAVINYFNKIPAIT
jgi:NTE family protein